MKGGLYDGLRMDDDVLPSYDWDDILGCAHPTSWDELERFEREDREWEESDAWDELNERSRNLDPYSTYFEVMARLDPVGDDEDPVREYELYCQLSEQASPAVNPQVVAAWQRHLRRGRARTSPYAHAAWVATMSV
ncbi:hypothetical protein IPM09_02980 [Candidatus Saccharibacteria bacterium]|nr:MAG: hypothetical protein IPM09_02980 [Candidatus Saccharibacteria bacterium]